MKRSHGWVWFLLAITPAVGCSGGSSDGSDTAATTTDAGPTPPSTPDLTGNWAGDFVSTITGSGGAIEADLSQAGEALSGTIELVGSPCFAVLDVTGTVTDDAFTLSAVDATTDVDMDGTIAADHLDGTYEVVTGGACTDDYGTFSADR